MSKIRPCEPRRLPLRDIDWSSFADLLGKAHATLARYDQIVQSVQHPEAVFSLIMYDELLASLQSRKVTISLNELLLGQALHSKEQNRCIQNYHRALIFAAKKVRKRPISLSLMCQMHKIIQQGVHQKTGGGQYRQKQNWIGPEGCKIKDAYFLPPPFQNVPKAMDNLKKYLNLKEKDPLVQLALFFAQLLIIHPFMDGNGRLARGLIPMILYKKKVISTPLFYLSRYFKKHRLRYLEKLFLISTNNEWEGWIHFFLRGVIEEGERSINKAEKILALYQELKAVKEIDHLFATPILKKEKLSQQSLNYLTKKKWIRPYAKAESMIVFSKLLNLKFSYKFHNPSSFSS